MQGSLQKLTGAAGLLVLLALLIVINVLAGQIRLRADTTTEKLYTLSDGTRELLAALPRDVTLKFYRTRNAENLPAAFKQYAQRIGDLLAEYEQRSGGRILLEVIDPQPDSDEEEWALRYGIAAQQVDALGEGPALYLGLAALSGSRQVSIPFFSPGAEPQLEYQISRLLTDVSRDKKPKLGVLSGLPVMGQPASFYSPGGGQPPWVFISELRNQYQVEQLPGAFAEVPAEVDTVLLVHPKRLPEPVLFALDQFVLRGGKLIAFTDPLCLSEQDVPGMAPGPADKNSDLNRLTAAWGLTQDTARVVADLAGATRVRMPDGSSDRNASWLSLRRTNLNREEIATANLETLMLPMAGYFSGAPADGLTLTPLITTSADAGHVSIMEATMGVAGGTSGLQPFGQPVHLAVRLTGTFKTAFPEGRPQDPQQPAVNPSPQETAATLKESAKDGLVVLMADADLLYDEFAVQRMNMMGRPLYQLANDNVILVANLVGQLTGGDQLISLRSRGTFERPFTRVLEVQKNAQEKWRAEEVKLQEQLQSTQRRLTELEAAKDPSQQYVVSPDQKREVEQFRTSALETRRQLKEVRKNLRREIEQLGLWLKGLNLAVMPGAVIAFGLFHGWRRRRQAGS